MQNTDSNSDAPQQGAEYRSLAPKRRARFQIHLSTAIVLMYVAGGLIWMNTTAFDVSTERYVGGEDTHASFIRTRRFGIPCAAFSYQMTVTEENGLPAQEKKLLSFEFSRSGIAINVAFALAILFAVWFLLEWLIRRRAARKGE